MKTTYLSSAGGGGGNPYSAPELTVIAVSAEQGFAGSRETYDMDDMDVQPEEEW
ncbi:hypothetical protein [Alistipes sp.]|uniref:hypothetical protein n=1 Tax=Alistipes sp. TaxID=1872444 RepID=UPI003AF03ECA